MAANVNIVPKPLIPLFQGGGILNLWNLAEEYGGGLALFNAIRRTFPNKFQPPVPNDYYLTLVSWLQQFTIATRNAAEYLNTDPDNPDESVLPKNFYVRRPVDSTCGFQIRATIGYFGSIQGYGKSLSMNMWFSDLSDLGAIRNEFKAEATETLGYMSANKYSKQTYSLDFSSFRFINAVRLC